jgi:hypothetical protein
MSNSEKRRIAAALENMVSEQSSNERSAEVVNVRPIYSDTPQIIAIQYPATPAPVKMPSAFGFGFGAAFGWVVGRIVATVLILTLILVAIILLIAFSSSHNRPIDTATPAAVIKTPAFDASLRESIKQNDINAIEKFLGNGGDINAKDESGKSLLQVARELQSWDVARLLVDHGAVRQNDPIK